MQGQSFLDFFLDLTGVGLVGHNEDCKRTGLRKEKFVIRVPIYWVMVLALPFEILGCNGNDGGSLGPQIDLEINVRQLCNYGVIAKTETRCDNSEQCNVGGIVDRYCWLDVPGDYKKGFCRQCVDSQDCLAGYGCDHRWCHRTCNVSSECESNEYCTFGYCRKPHTQGTQIAFRNKGDRDLTVYVNETKLVGGDDACAFSRLEWNPAGQDVVTLGPGEEDLFLSVKYTPPDVGEYRAILEIHSNAVNHNPLLLMFCGQAKEVVCSLDIDGTCPECASCTYDDFKDMIANPPPPVDCSDFD